MHVCLYILHLSLDISLEVENIYFRFSLRCSFFVAFCFAYNSAECFGCLKPKNFLLLLFSRRNQTFRE